MASIFEIQELAAKLNLSYIAKGDVNLQKETVSNLDYLKYVLESELEAHRAVAIQKRRKESRLPKKVFSAKNLSPGVKWHVEQLERLEWLREATDITIIGKCDSGKTALAAHLGELSLQEGMRVFLL